MSRPSIAASVTMLQGLAGYLDQGDANATLVFFDSIKPGSIAESVSDADKLLTLDFPKPCFKELTDSAVALYATDVGVAVKAGTATWARLYNGEGVAVVDIAAVTDFVLDKYELVVGATVKLDSVILSPQ
jgi:hypothetical protein